MFEGSLLESCGQAVSKAQRWSAAGSLVVQGAAAALLIAVPMLRPATMPLKVTPPSITAPKLIPVEIVRTVAASTVSSATGRTLPGPSTQVEHTRGIVFSRQNPASEDDPTPFESGPMTMGQSAGALTSVLKTAHEPVMVAALRPRTAAPLRISQGVSNGMLLTPIAPVYPAIAQVARVQGTVVIEAVISKAGRVESLNVVSGPAMLRAAALEAVERARYAPYKLNGEPVEVQTVIRVEFRMG